MENGLRQLQNFIQLLQSISAQVWRWEISSSLRTFQLLREIVTDLIMCYVYCHENKKDAKMQRVYQKFLLKFSLADFVV